MSRLASAWLIPICTVVAASSLVQITSSAPSSPSSSRPSLSKAAREAELSELLSSQLPPKSPSLSSLLPSRSLRGDRIVFQNDPRRVQALKPSRQEQQEQQELSSTDSNDGLRQLSRELLEQLRRKKQMLHLSKRKNRIQHPFSAEDGQLSPLQQLYQMSQAIEDQEEEQLLDQLQDEHQLQSPLQKRSHGEESLLEQLQNDQQQLRKRSQTIDIPSVEEGVPFVEDSNENAPTNKRHLWTETDHRREQERVRRRRKKARAKKQLKDMLGLTTAAERRRRRLDTMTPQEELSLKRQLDTMKQKEQEDAAKTLISLNVPFAHTSPEWKLAMLNYFVGMRAHGHQIVPLDLDVDENNNNNDEIFGDYGDYFDGGGGGGVGGAVGGVEVKEKKAFSNQEGVVCKVSPYRVCYRLGDDGELKPLGKAQPVNIMRVYRK